MYNIYIYNIYNIMYIYYIYYIILYIIYIYIPNSSYLMKTYLYYIPWMPMVTIPGSTCQASTLCQIAAAHVENGVFVAVACWPRL